jgi:hypothetical protein
MACWTNCSARSPKEAHFLALPTEQGGYGYDFTTPKGRAAAAEELLARFNESWRDAPSWVQHKIAQIRALFPRFFPSLQWTDADVRSLLQESTGRGDPVTSGRGVVRFSMQGPDSSLDSKSQPNVPSSSHGPNQMLFHRDSITGGETAIRGGSAPENPRPFVNGGAFPSDVRRRTEETYDGIETAADRLRLLFPTASEAKISERLLDVLRNADWQHSDPKLQAAINFLRERIPVVESKRIEALPKVVAGSESAVYFDEANRRAYKVVAVNDGFAGHGFIPGEVTVRPDGSIRVGAIQNVPAIEFLARLNRNNAQGRMVFTEPAGITTGGQLVLRQPLVSELQATTSGERPALAKKLGLTWLNAIPRNASTVGRVGDRLLLVDDLHEANLMKDSAGTPFIVDANSRFLSPNEETLVRGALALRSRFLPPN